MNRPIAAISFGRVTRLAGRDYVVLGMQPASTDRNDVVLFKRFLPTTVSASLGKHFADDVPFLSSQWVRGITSYLATHLFRKSVTQLFSVGSQSFGSNTVVIVSRSLSPFLCVIGIILAGCLKAGFRVIFSPFRSSRSASFPPIITFIPSLLICFPIINSFTHG